MPTLNCPQCGDEFEFSISLGEPEYDIGIMSHYIDDIDAPDTCGNCGASLEDFIEKEADSHSDKWIEAELSGRYEQEYEPDSDERGDW